LKTRVNALEAIAPYEVAQQPWLRMQRRKRQLPQPQRDAHSRAQARQTPYCTGSICVKPPTAGVIGPIGAAAAGPAKDTNVVNAATLAANVSFRIMMVSRLIALYSPP
jgi:hypothetical protein